MSKNALYVGMMWDIATALNLEDFDKIYVMDMIDLSYGQFIEGKINSWNTLKEKIKNILIDGYYYDEYYHINQYIKYGKATIINETEKIEYLENDKYKWELDFMFNLTNKKVKLIFYVGYNSDSVWPDDIKDIHTIFTFGACFGENWDITKKMIIERCCLPFSYYKLYFSCDKTKYEKIGENVKMGKLKDVLFFQEIGKTLITDLNDMIHIIQC